jgi:superfamily II DNA or RNA helicase
LFGPVVYSKSYGDAVKDGAIVPIKVYWVECPRPAHFHGYTTKNGCYRNAVWRNTDMHAIVATVLERVSPDVQVLCVVDKLEHMNFLCPYLPGVTMVHAETADKALTSNRYSNLHAVSRQERKRIYTQASDGTLKRILSTGVYRAGVNFPDLQVLVNCEGMGSQIIAGQLPGRASRVTEEKNMGYIVDFHHPWDMVEKHGRQSPGMLLRDDRSRESVYTSLGFDQEWVTDISTLSFR